MISHEVDYEIMGSDLQIVEIENLQSSILNHKR